MNILTAVFQLVFIHIFTWQMLKVNEQLKVFFKQLNDETYAKITVKITLVLYYLIVIISSIMLISYDYLNLHLIWWALPNSVRLIYE